MAYDESRQEHSGKLTWPSSSEVPLVSFASCVSDTPCCTKPHGCLVSEELLDYFNDIADAKNKLISAFNQALTSVYPFRVERPKSSNTRSAGSRSRGCVAMIDPLDRQKLLANVKFAVLAFDRILKCRPEETNMLPWLTSRSILKLLHLFSH
jgi:hypothetical protein